MLVDPPLEKVIQKADCAYELAILVSKRARQLTAGAQPTIDSKAANMVSLACQEVAAGTVVRVKGVKEDKVVIPKTKEAREKERLARESRERYEREMEEISANSTEEAVVSSEAAMDDIISVVDEFEPIVEEDEDMEPDMASVADEDEE